MSDRWGTQLPGFNRAAAETVFKAVMAMEDGEAEVFARMLVGAGVQRDLEVHRGQIAKVLDAHFAERAELARERLSKAAVAKARAGQDNLPELYALTELAKAYDPNEARDAAGRWTDSGRSLVEHANIDYRNVRGLRGPHAEALGIPHAAGLTGKDKAHYQHAYRQVSDLAARYRGMGEDALLHLNVRQEDGNTREDVVRIPARDKPLTLNLQPGDRIESAAVSVHPKVGAPGAAYDTLAALNPRAGALGANLVNNGALNTARIKQFGEEVNAEPSEQEAYTPSARLFRRLGAGAKLLDDSLGDAAPRKLQMALAVGQHVGNYGPEAQKVIGPLADRTAYRYRGTERTVDSSLQRDMKSDMDAALPGERREAMISGSKDKGVWVPSKTLEYFKGLLPKPDLNQLHLSSGTVPPSQGVIIDRRGRPVVQAVGYGDDWYLPFNLKNLAKLKGGEYIRTRSWGGPTTEDVYTALASGAHSMTVVSHNGVYTLEFHRDLRGGRRFNDKAARMVARYGQLLDAVKSHQVTAGSLHPSRTAELRREAAERYDPVDDRKDFEAEFERLKARQHENPTLSRQQTNEASVEWLRSVAAQQKTASGQVMTPEEYVGQLVSRTAERAHGAHVAAAQTLGVAPVRSLDQHRAAAMEQLVDEDPAEAARKIAAATGQTKALETYLQRVQEQYAASLRPMQLNGTGYDNALQALREQFPYYIARVSYHPWADAVQRSDTGYVKPRHNRPERALAGYFDPTITGHGKVSADSTRYQNFPVRRGKLHYVGSKEGEGKQPEGKAGERAPSPEAAAAQRAKADHELLSHLFGLRFHDEAKLGDAAVGGRSPVEDAKDRNFPAGPLKELFTKSPAELENKPEEMHRLIDQVLRLHEQAGGKLFAGLDEAKVKAFRNGGQVAKPTPLPTSTREVLNHLDEDRSFGSVFDPSRGASTQQLTDAYSRDPVIRDAVSDGHLPAHLDEDGFSDRIGDAAARLRQANNRQLADEGAGVRVPDSDKRSLHRKAEALARAAQLRRRYDEAVDREKARAELGHAQGAQDVSGDQHSLHIHGPEALDRLIEAMHGRGQEEARRDNPRVIDA